MTFEQWYKSSKLNGFRETALMAWEASREAAIDECAKICKDKAINVINSNMKKNGEPYAPASFAAGLLDDCADEMLKDK